jgi:hemoglobin
MAWAMEDMGLPETLRERLVTSFFNTADWMRNRPG